MPIFGDLERFAADLYPYRWPITIGLALLLAGAIAFAWRRGWHLVLWRHKLISVVAAASLLVVAVPASDYLLSPLWERSYLEEASPLDIVMDMDGAHPGGASPVPSPTGGAPASPSPTPDVTAGRPAATPQTTFGPRVTLQGEFHGADDFHFGRGKALLIETEPGRHTLRFEDFSVRNGPDLFVYLSPSAGGNAEGSIDLGGLKATDGAFNYDVPPGTDVSQFKSAIVWCREFSVLFAVAPLVPVP